MVACLKLAIKIGCVALGTLALAVTTAYLVSRKRKRHTIKIDLETNPKPSQKTGTMDSKEFVARLRERKKKGV